MVESFPGKPPSKFVGIFFGGRVFKGRGWLGKLLRIPFGKIGETLGSIGEDSGEDQENHHPLRIRLKSGDPTSQVQSVLFPHRFSHICGNVENLDELL